MALPHILSRLGERAGIYSPERESIYSPATKTGEKLKLPKIILNLFSEKNKVTKTKKHWGLF